MELGGARGLPLFWATVLIAEMSRFREEKICYSLLEIEAENTGSSRSSRSSSRRDKRPRSTGSALLDERETGAEKSQMDSMPVSVLMIVGRSAELSLPPLPSTKIIISSSPLARHNSDKKLTGANTIASNES